MNNNSSPALGRVKRILVRGVNWVGDSIISYPAVQQLKTLFPESHLSILIPETLIDLWKTFPYVDEIISFQKKKGWGSLREDLKIIRTLRKKKFDMAVILPRSFHSAIHIFLAGIPIRIGYRSSGRSLFLTHGVRRTQESLRIHRVHYYLNLLEPLGKIEGVPPPQIFLREEERRWADRMLKDLGIKDDEILIGMNPGATYGLAKCWYAERFGELGKRVAGKRRARVLLFGKAEDQPIVHEILRHMGSKGMDMTGKTSLLQLSALLERCHLLVTNDTGTMHVAAAVGTPVVALFGPTDPASTGPWGDGHLVVSRGVCSPCWKRICPTDHRCMERITVDEVEATVNKQLERKRK